MPPRADSQVVAWNELVDFFHKGPSTLDSSPPPSPKASKTPKSTHSKAPKSTHSKAPKNATSQPGIISKARLPASANPIDLSSDIPSSPPGRPSQTRSSHPPIDLTADDSVSEDAQSPLQASQRVAPDPSVKQLIGSNPSKRLSDQRLQARSKQADERVSRGQKPSPKPILSTRKQTAGFIPNPASCPAPQLSKRPRLRADDVNKAVVRRRRDVWEIAESDSDVEMDLNHSVVKKPLRIPQHQEERWLNRRQEDLETSSDGGVIESIEQPTQVGSKSVEIFEQSREERSESLEISGRTGKQRLGSFEIDEQPARLRPGRSKTTERSERVRSESVESMELPGAAIDILEPASPRKQRPGKGKSKASEIAPKASMTRPKAQSAANSNSVLGSKERDLQPKAAAKPKSTLGKRVRSTTNTMGPWLSRLEKEASVDSGDQDLDCSSGVQTHIAEDSETLAADSVVVHVEAQASIPSSKPKKKNPVMQSYRKRRPISQGYNAQGKRYGKRK